MMSEVDTNLDKVKRIMANATCHYVGGEATQFECAPRWDDAPKEGHEALAEQEAEELVRSCDAPPGGWSKVVPSWRELAWTERLAEIHKYQATPEARAADEVRRIASEQEAQR